MTLAEAAASECPLVRWQARRQQQYESGELYCSPELLAALVSVWERNRRWAQVHQAAAVAGRRSSEVRAVSPAG